MNTDLASILIAQLAKHIFKATAQTAVNVQTSTMSRRPTTSMQLAIFYILILETDQTSQSRMQTLAARSL